MRTRIGAGVSSGLRIIRHDFCEEVYEEPENRAASNTAVYTSTASTFIIEGCTYEQYKSLVQHMGTLLTRIQSGQDPFAHQESRQLDLIQLTKVDKQFLAARTSPTAPVQSAPTQTNEHASDRELFDGVRQVLSTVAAAIEAAPESEPPPPREPVPADAPTAPPAPVTKLEPAAVEPAVVEDPDAPTIEAFEKDCDKVRTVDDAVRVWFDHAAAIKKLPDSSKRRCSTTLSLRLSTHLCVEPLEAQELIKAGVAKAQADKKAAVAKVQPEPVTKPAADTTDKQAEFLQRLTNDKQPSLGIAVKLACQVLAKNGEVSYVDVEQLLCDMVGKHPALESTDAILKITQTSKMKLYAGAAKVKLV